MNVRVTLLSYLAGLPYSLIPTPGPFIAGGTPGGSSALACFAPPASRPVAAIRPALCLMKLRLDSSIVEPPGESRAAPHNPVSDMDATLLDARHDRWE
jgi:hypothetical protein